MHQTSVDSHRRNDEIDCGVSNVRFTPLTAQVMCDRDFSYYCKVDGNQNITHQPTTESLTALDGNKKANEGCHDHRSKANFAVPPLGPAPGTSIGKDRGFLKARV